MKTRITLVLAFLITSISFAQQGINYKALIKDNLGNVVANQTIDVRFTIIADTGPTDVYTETHTGATTDANGIVILNIGDGTSGDVFTDIAWGSDIHSLKVEIDIEQDASFVDMGTTQFMAVPYAISSNDSYWSKSGNTIYTLHDDVGINSMNPEHTLDVRASSLEAAAQLNVSNQDRSRYLRLFSGSDMFPDPSFTWAPGRSLLFASFDDVSFTFNEYMRISSTGNVGIGVVVPNHRLEVDGKIKLADDANAPEAGTMRYNAATKSFEGYDGSNWVSLSPQEKYILGPSNISSDGSFDFGSVTGLEAATSICRDTYPNEPTAHFYTAEEIDQAIGNGNINGIPNNTEYWTVKHTFQGFNASNSQNNNCFNFLTTSDAIARGTTVTFFLNSQTPLGLVGNYTNYQFGKFCNTQLQIVCGR